jgi:Tol biopolymer transport system component
VDLETRESEVIPVRVRTKKKVHPTLRFAVDAAPEQLDVKMLRWSQMSPDGSKVLFQALGHLYVKDLETGRQSRLTQQDDHFEFYPSFSHDGSRVLYTTWSDSDLGSIRIVPATGGAGRVVSREPGIYVEPRFSPDGKRIVYRKISGGYLLSGEWSLEPGIYFADLGGDEPVRVSKSGFEPRFSTNGKRVMFSDVFEETTLVLKSVTLAGHDERTHLSGAAATEFSVSPDGRWVAFSEQYNAYVAPFTLTGKTRDRLESGIDSRQAGLEALG